MKVLLVYPPDRCPPMIPYSSLAQLAGVLKQAGHEVSIRDVNAEAFAWLNDRDRLAGYYDYAQRQLAELEARPTLDASARGVYRFLAPLMAAPRESFLFAPEAAAIMKDPARFYDPKLFNQAFDSLQTMIRLACASNPIFDPENRYFIQKTLTALSQPFGDPISDSYKNGIVDSLLAEKPELVGFTLPFNFQFFEMLKLARLIKERAPAVKIVIGGPTVNDYAYRVFATPALAHLIDFGVAGEGERAIVGLVAALERGGGFDQVPNLHWFEGSGESATVHKSALPPDVPDLNDFPSPDFRGINFDHYLSPARIANLQTSRGCYYGKCTFCGDGFRRNFRMRAPDRVYEDIKKIHVDCGVDHFLFWDSLAPPKTLKHVAVQIAAHGDPITWFAETKFEKPYANPQLMETLAKGGCRFLQFGFESASQRVLDLIDKGNDLERVDVILGLMKQHKIQAGLSWFIGFPTATPEEDVATYDFVNARADRIGMSVYTGTFILGRDTLVFSNPDRFGVKILEKDDGSVDFEMKDGTHHYDRTELDLAFRARGDLPLVNHGGYLLYAAHRQDRQYEITSAGRSGPLAKDVPDLPARRLYVTDGVSLRDFRWNAFATDDAGFEKPVRVAHNEKTSLCYPLEPIEALLMAQADGKRTVAELVRMLSGRFEQVDGRIRRLIDRGLLCVAAEVPSPALAT
ncbi:MAG: B12-binding domain-containing radical SAM protein [Planctomycetes bacterium]|nr:B12-binding domain-containing radical SAM protein [Planctomycetota bacterium]